MKLTPTLRPPAPSDACANPAVVRRFTMIKLLILLLLIVSVILLPRGPDIMAPILEPPPTVILTGELHLDGRGTPGSTVEVLANGSFLGVSIVAADGRWELAPSLRAGDYDLLAQAVVEGDERLSVSRGQGQLAVVDRPTLEFSSLRPRGEVAEVLLFGKGTPGSTLHLLRNEEAVAALEVGTAGDWQHLLASVRVPSENAFVAQVVDDAGVVLGSSEPQHLTLVAPVPLAIEHATFGRPVRSPRQKLVDGYLQVEGTGEPGAWITLWRDGASSGPATTVADDGQWVVAAHQSLPSGEQSFSVRMSADDELLEEGGFSVAVPPLPTLAVAGGETDVEDVLFSGTAQPDDTLTLYVDDEIVDTVRADGSGQWQYATRLKAGSHRVVVRSASGLDSDPTELTLALARPVITGQSRDEAGKVVPGFFGTGRPQVALEILEAGAVIGQARVDGSGHWVCSCTLAPGEYTVSVREVDEPERSSQPLTITVENPVSPFVVGTAAPDAPPFRCPDLSPPGAVEGTVYVVGCGESLSLIATRLSASVDALLAHNPQLSDPARVYFGQRLNVPAGAACFDVAGE